MRKDELIEFLEENGATEVGLSEADVPYYIHHVSDEVGVSGYALVKLEDGDVLIPYDNVYAAGHKGYEQLNLTEIRDANDEVIDTIKTEIESNLKTFMRLSYPYTLTFEYDGLATGEENTRTTDVKSLTEAWKEIVNDIEEELDDCMVELEEKLREDNLVEVLEGLSDIRNITVQKEEGFVLLETTQSRNTWKIQKK